MSLRKILSKHSIWIVIIVIAVLALITGWLSSQHLDRIDRELNQIRRYENQ